MVERKYYYQLDGVRALAISAVFIGHFLEKRFVAELVGWGDTGVILFFCLSGFLITEILLNLDRSPGARGVGIRAFYARRMLRIFPIYYLVLFAGLVVGYAPISEHFGRFATYTLNLPILPPTENLGAAEHFWSLSVEEQFYLFWPTVVVFWPRKNLRSLVVAIILASLTYKFALAFADHRYKLIFWNVFGCMDSLGLGALLAVHKREHADRPSALKPFMIAGLAAAVGWLALTTIRVISDVDPWFSGQRPLAVAYFACGAAASTGLVAFALQDSQTWIGRLLSAPPLRYIGKISYGLYVYHFFVWHGLKWASANDYIPVTGDLELALVGTILTLAIAAASWHAFESPILGLKRHFEYRRQTTVPPIPDPVT